MGAVVMNDWFIMFETFLLSHCLGVGKIHMIRILLNLCKLKYKITTQNYVWAASWQNKKNDLCVQQRLRSAWAPIQPDQSLRCPHEETLGSKQPIGALQRLIRLGGPPPRLIWVFTGRTVILLVLSCGGSFVNKTLASLLMAIWNFFEN